MADLRVFNPASVNSTLWDYATRATFDAAPIKQVVVSAGETVCTGFTGTDMVVFNDGAGDVTISVNSLTIIVKGGTFYGTATGEVAAFALDPFTSYTITAANAFRIWVKGV